MAVALGHFVKQLADSGLIAPGKLENFVPPKAQPKDAQELARQLVQSKHLTKFQAQEIYRGRAKTLILGSYTILDKIGAGGMGQVFKAEHRRMKRVVAIKMLPKAIMKDGAAAARFQREVEAAAKLSHPNIVAAHDADEAGGVNFLVMEYVDGSDLSALVKNSGRLSVGKAVRYILQVARGLDYAHKCGVIHRDIKPANLLLNSEGTVKILDLGLARIDAGGDAATQAELTGTGAVLGTVDYMAPEQALSTKHVDARADIYSLGCSLYYLLTGKATYDSDTLMAKLLAHPEAPIPALGDNVLEQLQTVFKKMVAKKVEDRYQTMSEVVAALEQYRSGHPASVSIKQSVGTNADAGTLAFLADAPAQTTHNSKPVEKTAPTNTGKFNKKFALSTVGAGFLSLAILAGVIFKMQTKDGTLVVEVNQPDAVVQVLNEAGKVEITEPGEKGTISISVDPGKHRLRVEKDRFRFFVKDFEMESGGTQSIKATLEPLTAVENAGQANKPWYAPAFQQWIKEVAALPVEKQLEAVIKKLQEFNPGFDGKETHEIENGVVTSLTFVSDKVTDISPVRALVGLKTLNCAGSSQGKGILVDLLPLRGMTLTNLLCYSTNVSDLSPLNEMPLTKLDCGVTPVADLSPLKGMPLTGLTCGGTKVSDLSPLRGMPLTTLNVGGSPVSELSPLQGMPLTSLGCGHTPVSDLAPLKHMKLTNLHCDNSRVSDLSPLHGMPLTSLDCTDTKVSDLSPLEGMHLKDVSFTPRNIRVGLEILRQMPSLQTIRVAWHAAGMPPEQFWQRYNAGEFLK